MTMMAKTFLSTTEIAEQLGVTSQTVRNWIRDGLIRAYRLNPAGSILVKQEDLERAIEEGKL